MAVQECQPTEEEEKKSKILERDRMKRALDVIMVTSLASRKSVVHGVEPEKGSRFWAISEEDEDSESHSDVKSISSLELVREAQEAGFTTEDLRQAKKEIRTLISGRKMNKVNLRLGTMAKRIIDTMVENRQRRRRRRRRQRRRRCRTREGDPGETMRGRRRLRIAPVGDIRRRWATNLTAEEKVITELVSEVGDSLIENRCLDDSDEDIEWSSPVESRRVSSDPLHGLRPQGFKTCFGIPVRNQTRYCHPPYPHVDDVDEEIGISGWSFHG